VRTLAEHCGHTDASASPKIVTRPIGPLAYLFEIWRNHPTYDAAVVKTPTLVIGGNRDMLADQRLAAKIPGAQERITADAAHWGPYERNRNHIIYIAERFLANE
jgi:pimeloyl-ACP methyl ester carboxylesterase